VRTKVSLRFDDALEHADLTNAGLTVECAAGEVPGQAKEFADGMLGRLPGGLVEGAELS
jgi:hypothetical protein